MNLQRRALLRMGGAALVSVAASTLVTPALASAAASALGGIEPHLKKADLKKVKAPHRALSFECLNTGEKLKVDYWADGKYIPDALATINHLLRDFRTGDVHAIEPALLDLLNAINTKMENKATIEVISGYRSPATNAKLHEHSNGVAKRSLHMEGKAMDIRMGNKPLKDLHNAALKLKAGGVGFYPQSNFVHVDVGKVRSWQGA